MEREPVTSEALRSVGYREGTLVVSSTLESPQWSDTTVLRGDVVDAVTELRERYERGRDRPTVVVYRRATFSQPTSTSFASAVMVSTPGPQTTTSLAPSRARIVSLPASARIVSRPPRPSSTSA